MTNAVAALDKGRPRAGLLIAAVGALATGMFAGAWIIGPSFSSNPVAKERAADGSLSYQQMIARPDPFPYRAATPSFPQQAQTDYASAARERARGDYGTHAAEESYAANSSQQQPGRSSYRYTVPDRHTSNF